MNEELRVKNEVLCQIPLSFRNRVRNLFNYGVIVVTGRDLSLLNYYTLVVPLARVCNPACPVKLKIIFLQGVVE